MPCPVVDVAPQITLLALGVVFALAGLGSDRALLLVAGALLVVLAALGPHATRVCVRLPGVRLTLERRVPTIAESATASEGACEHPFE